MIIAIDFDGTLVRDEYPEIGQPRDGAVQAMQRLKADGHYLIIWTCRTGDRLLEAINFLLAHNIPFDRVNDHEPNNLATYGEGGKKIFADVYVDDKQVGGLPHWMGIYNYIKGLNGSKSETLRVPYHQTI